MALLSPPGSSFMSLLLVYTVLGSIEPRASGMALMHSQSSSVELGFCALGSSTQLWFFFFFLIFGTKNELRPTHIEGNAQPLNFNAALFLS